MAGELAVTAGTDTALFGPAVCLGAIGALTVWRMAESGTTAASARGRPPGSTLNRWAKKRRLLLGGE